MGKNSQSSLLPSCTSDSNSEVYYSSVEEKKDNGRCLSAISISLSVVAILLFLSFGAAFYFVILPQLKSNAGEHQVPLPSKERTKAFACIPCVKLLRHPTENRSDNPLLRKLSVEVTDGRSDCCAYTSEQVTALFESIVHLNDGPEPRLATYNVTDFTFSPVSAHKRLYPKRIVHSFGIPEIPNEPHVCEFKPDDARYGLEHHRGVNILSDGIEIKYGGLYYLYTSIQFRPQSLKPCRQFGFQTFSAYVEKISYRHHGSQIILKTSHTCCDQCVNTQETRFTGGIFVLEPKDIVRVKVTGFELVHFQAQSSFAGLAMLGTPDSDSSEVASEEKA